MKYSLTEEKKKLLTDWLATRPAVIQELNKKYPRDIYRIKEGAPYGLTAPGTIVFIYSYHENGDISVIVTAGSKTERAREHELALSKKYNKTREETLQILNSNVNTPINPKWLEVATPQFKHDCKECIFLGPYTENNGVVSDLYYCAQDNLPTVLGRYSDEPSDYISGLEFANAQGSGHERPFIRMIKEAKTRAEILGLIE